MKLLFLLFLGSLVFARPDFLSEDVDKVADKIKANAGSTQAPITIPPAELQVIIDEQQKKLDDIANDNPNYMAEEKSAMQTIMEEMSQAGKAQYADKKANPDKWNEAINPRGSLPTMNPVDIKRVSAKAKTPAVAAPAPTAGPVADPSPTAGPVADPSPTAGAVADPSPTADPVADPSPTAGAVADPSPTAGAVADLSPTAAPVASGNENPDPTTTAAAFESPEDPTSTVASPASPDAADDTTTAAPVIPEGEDGGTQDSNTQSANMPDDESVVDKKKRSAFEIQSAFKKRSAQRKPSAKVLDRLRNKKNSKHGSKHRRGVAKAERSALNKLFVAATGDQRLKA